MRQNNAPTMHAKLLPPLVNVHLKWQVQLKKFKFPIWIACSETLRQTSSLATEKHWRTKLTTSRRSQVISSRSCWTFRIVTMIKSTSLMIRKYLIKTTFDLKLFEDTTRPRTDMTKAMLCSMPPTNCSQWFMPPVSKRAKTTIAFAFYLTKHSTFMSSYPLSRITLATAPTHPGTYSNNYLTETLIVRDTRDLDSLQRQLRDAEDQHNQLKEEIDPLQKQAEQFNNQAQEAQKRATSSDVVRLSICCGAKLWNNIFRRRTSTCKRRKTCNLKSPR